MTAWGGVSEVAFHCGSEQVRHPRERFGGRRVCYRHYLAELSRKPRRCVRSRRNWSRNWADPTPSYGRRWSSNAAVMRPPEPWRGSCRRPPSTERSSCGGALEAGLAEGGFDELALRRSLAAVQETGEVTVPERLRGYRVERASAADYDRLLEGVSR